MQAHKKMAVAKATAKLRNKPHKGIEFVTSSSYGGGNFVVVQFFDARRRVLVANFLE
jgi:hypothetical protein